MTLLEEVINNGRILVNGKKIEDIIEEFCYEDLFLHFFGKKITPLNRSRVRETLVEFNKDIIVKDVGNYRDFNAFMVSYILSPEFKEYVETVKENVVPLGIPTGSAPGLAITAHMTRLMGAYLGTEPLQGAETFSDLPFYDIQGRKPTNEEREVMRAMIVGLCSHGSTPASTHGLQTSAAVKNDLYLGYVGFINNAIGPLHFGALKNCMELYKRIDSTENVEEILTETLEEGGKVPGFGHRVHEIDPRVGPLKKIAGTNGFNGKYMEIFNHVSEFMRRQIRGAYPSGIYPNIDGINAALYLDMGFSPEITLGFVVQARTPHIIMHYDALYNGPCSPFVGLIRRDRLNRALNSSPEAEKIKVA